MGIAYYSFDGNHQIVLGYSSAGLPMPFSHARAAAPDCGFATPLLYGDGARNRLGQTSRRPKHHVHRLPPEQDRDALGNDLRNGADIRNILSCWSRRRPDAHMYCDDHRHRVGDYSKLAHRPVFRRRFLRGPAPGGDAHDGETAVAPGGNPVQRFCGATRPARLAHHWRICKACRGIFAMDRLFTGRIFLTFTYRRIL